MVSTLFFWFLIYNFRSSPVSEKEKGLAPFFNPLIQFALPRFLFSSSSLFFVYIHTRKMVAEASIRSVTPIILQFCPRCLLRLFAEVVMEVAIADTVV